MPTPCILLTDLDFILDKHVSSRIRTHLKSGILEDTQGVLVVPVFEFTRMAPNEDFPANKKAMETQCLKGNTEHFHAYLQGHSLTVNVGDLNLQKYVLN